MASGAENRDRTDTAPVLCPKLHALEFSTALTKMISEKL
jgi:hypothetical protein